MFLGLLYLILADFLVSALEGHGPMEHSLVLSLMIFAAFCSSATGSTEKAIF